MEDKKNNALLGTLFRILIFFGFLIIAYFSPLANFIVKAFFYEFTAISLSIFSIWFCGKFRYIKFLYEGDDNKLNSIERSSVLTLFGSIALGAHIIIGILAIIENIPQIVQLIKYLV